jgi:hypothetical protein
VNSLKSNQEDRSVLAELKREVKLLLGEVFEITHCDRSQNRVAHYLARHACNEGSCIVGLKHIPPHVKHHYDADYNPILS